MVSFASVIQSWHGRLTSPHWTLLIGFQVNPPLDIPFREGLGCYALGDRSESIPAPQPVQSERRKRQINLTYLARVNRGMVCPWRTEGSDYASAILPNASLNGVDTFSPAAFRV